MSYELADARVADMSAQVWTLTHATFTGAAILLREKAAYRDTSFSIRKPGAPVRRAVLASTMGLGPPPAHRPKWECVR